MSQFSLIVPVLNEAARIQSQLGALQTLREEGHEIIVVDGGSADASAALAQPLADQVITAVRGRAVQMNAGASAACKDWLLFLHLDSTLPPTASTLLNQQIAESGREWGWFDVRLDNPGWPYRVIAWHMNRRARLTRVCTGDQGLFVSRHCFQTLGGFPELSLMEDVALSKLLRRRSQPLVVPGPITTSARRWEQHGVIRTVLLMWRLRLLYWLGISPDRLLNQYYQSRS